MASWTPLPGGDVAVVVEQLHADDAVAAVDVVNLAADAAGEVGKQVERRAADLVDGDVAAERRVGLLPVQHVAQPGDAGGGKGLDGAGGDGVDADAVLAHVDREIAHR